MKIYKKFNLVLLFILCLLIGYSFQLSAANRISNYKSDGVIRIPSGDIVKITSNNNVISCDKLIIEEGAKVTYDTSEQFDVTIKVKNYAEINGTIDLSGEEGDTGPSNGYMDAGDGTNGKEGRDLTLQAVTGEVHINGKIITDGGTGGAGGSPHDRNESHMGDGHAGGDGGKGGKGGKGGNITITARKLKIEEQARINFYGGLGGSGGQGADGYPIWKDDGSDGSPGTDGASGEIEINMGYGNISYKTIREEKNLYLDSEYNCALIEKLDRRDYEIKKDYTQNESYGAPYEEYAHVYEEKNIEPEFSKDINIKKDESYPNISQIKTEIDNNEIAVAKYTNQADVQIEWGAKRGQFKDQGYGIVIDDQKLVSGVKDFHLELRYMIKEDVSFARINDYLDTIEQRVDTFTQKYKTLDDDLTSLKNERDNIEAELIEKRETLESMRDSDSSSRGNPYTGGVTEDELKEDINNLETELARKKDEIFELKKFDLRVAETKKEFYKAQYNESKQYLRIIDDYFSKEIRQMKLTQYIANFNTRISELNGTKTNTKGKLDQLKEDKNTLQNELSDRRELLKQLINYNSTSRAPEGSYESAPTEKTEVELKFEIDELEEKIEKTKEDIEQMKLKLADINLNIEKLQLRRKNIKEIAKYNPHTGQYELIDGEYKLVTSLRDNNGNESSLSKIKDFYIDTRKPSKLNKSKVEITDDGEADINWSNISDIENHGFKSGRNQYKIEFENEAVEYTLHSQTTENLSEFGFNEVISYTINTVDKAGNLSEQYLGKLITPPAKAKIKNIASGGDVNNGYYVNLEIDSLVGKAAQYKISRKQSGENKWTLVSDWKEVPQQQSSFEVADKSTSLAAHGEYIYKIETKNKANDFVSTNQDKIVKETKEVQEIKNNRPQAQGKIMPKNDSPILGIDDKTVKLGINAFTDGDNDSLSYEFIIENEQGTEVYSNSSKEQSEEKIKQEIDLSDLANGKYEWYVLVKDGYLDTGDNDTVEDNEKESTPKYSFTIDKQPPQRPKWEFKEGNISTVKDEEVNISSAENIIYTTNSEIFLENIEVQDDDVTKLKVNIYDTDNNLINSVTKNITFDETSPSKLANPLKINLGSQQGEKRVELITIDKAGNLSSNGSTSQKQVIDCVYDNQVPTNPKEIESNLKNDKLVVDWPQGTDDLSGIDYYELKYKTGTNEFGELIKVNKSDYAITDLPSNQPVQVKLRAVDKAGNQNSNSIVSDLMYSAPEKGEIKNHTFSYKKTETGFQNYIQLELNDAAAEAWQIKYQRLKNDGSYTNPNQSNWITKTNFESEVIPHGVYRFWVVTRNKNEDIKVSEKEKIKVENNDPSRPEIDTEKYRYISLPTELKVKKAVDPDDDPLTYYLTITNEAGKEIVTKTQNDNEQPVVYDLSEENLVEGNNYSLQVKVKDGYQGISASIPKSVTTTIDLTEPQIDLPDNKKGDFLPKLNKSIKLTDEISGIKKIKYWWNDNQSEARILNYQELVSDKSISINADDGVNELKIRAVDRAGNETDLQTKTYRVDKTPPEINKLLLDAKKVNNEYYINSENSLLGSWKIEEDKNISLKYYKYAVITGEERANLDSVAEDRFTKVKVESAPNKSGTGVFEYDISKVIEKSLVKGKEYYLVVEAVNQADRSTGKVVSQNSVMINTPPEINGISLDGVIKGGDKNYVPDFSNLDVEVEATDSAISESPDLKYALVQNTSSLESETWFDNLTDLKAALQVDDGEIYYLAIKAIDKLGLSDMKYTKPLVIDQTKPEINKFIAGEELKIDGSDDSYQIRPGYNIPVTLNIKDEIDLKTVSYSIGTEPGSNDVSKNLYPDKNGWINLSTETEQQFLVDEELTEGKYYLNVKVINEAGLEVKTSSNPIEINTTNNPVPQVKDDGQFSTNRHELHFNWKFTDAPQKTEHYEYQIVTSSQKIKDWTEITADKIEDEYDYIATDLELSDGEKYFVKVRALYQDGSYSNVGYSDGIVVDSTNPQKLLIKDKDYITGNKIYLEWSAVDKQSAIKNYKVKIGTSPGGDSITEGWIKLDNSGRGILDGYDLEVDQVYFTTLKVSNRAGLTKEKVSDGFRVDNTKPTPPKVSDDGKYNNQLELEFDWKWGARDAQSGIKCYEYALLTKRQVGNNTNWQSAGTDTNITITENLIEDQIYYLAVKAINGAGQVAIGYSNGVKIDTTIPTVLKVDDLTDYQALEKKFLEAEFNAQDFQSGIDHYEYSIGTFNNSNSITDSKAVSTGNVREEDLSLEADEVYFFTVKAVNQAGLVSSANRSDGIKIVDGYPQVEDVKDYGDYTSVNNQLVVSWDKEPSGVPIDHYEYTVTKESDAQMVESKWYTTDKEQVTITSEQIEGQEFDDGGKYYVHVRGVDIAGNRTPLSQVKRTDGIKVDSTPPKTPVIKHEYKYTTKRFNLNWTSDDPHSEIEEYRYAVGTTRGGTDITGGWKYISDQEYKKSENQILDLKHNDRYYLTVQAKNAAGLWSPMGFDQGVIADLTPPEKPTVEYRGNLEYGSYITSLEKISDVRWLSSDKETDVVGYRYQVTKTNDNINWEDVKWHDTAKEELIIDIENLNLNNDEKYYVAVQTKNYLGKLSDTGVSELLIVDTKKPKIKFENQEEELVTNSGNLAVPWNVSEKSTIYYELEKPNGTVETKTKSNLNGDNVYQFNKDREKEGIYYLKLYAVDRAGNKGAIVTQRIRLNAKPRIYMGENKTDFKGREVEFTANIADPDAQSGDEIEYLWEFGDGKTVSGKVEVPEGYENLNSIEKKKLQITTSHSYKELSRDKEDGKYEVQLTCVDSDQGENENSVLAEITNTTAGRLHLNETWFGQMKITDTVIVPGMIDLKIAPGTEIEFERGTRLIVHGNLIVEGNTENRSLFTTKAFEWGGIKVTSEFSQANITSAIIERAKQGIALKNNDNSTISNLIARNNKVGLHLVDSSPLIKESEFLNNRLYGIKEDGTCKPELILNDFIGNIVGDYYDSKETILKEEEVVNLNLE